MACVNPHCCSYWQDGAAIRLVFHTYILTTFLQSSLGLSKIGKKIGGGSFGGYTFKVNKTAPIMQANLYNNLQFIPICPIIFPMYVLLQQSTFNSVESTNKIS